MREPENIQHVPINENRGFVTNSDSVKLSENYAEEMSGFRIPTPGTIAIRDEGTRNRFASANYPKTKHTAGSGSLSSLIDGGGTTIFDQTTGYEHHIVSGLDRNEATHKVRLNVDVSSDESGTWRDLTRLSYGVIGSISTNKIIIPLASLHEDEAVANSDATIYNSSNDGLKGWYAINKTLLEGTTAQKNSAFVLIADYAVVTTNLEITVYGDLAGLGWAGGNAVWFVSSRAIIEMGTEGLYLDYSNGLAASWNHIEANRKANLHLWTGASVLPIGQVPLRIQKREIMNLFYRPPTTAVTVWKGKWVAGTYNQNDGVEHGSPIASYVCKVAITSKEPEVTTGWATDWEKSTPMITIPAGWYVERVEQGTTVQRMGTSDDPIRVTDVAQVFEFTNSNLDLRWLKISLEDITDGPTILRDGSAIIMSHFYFTVLFDDSQESDPILQGYGMSSNSVNQESPNLLFQIFVSPGKMNQHVSGLRLWGATITAQEWTAGRRELADGEYRLNKTFYFRKDNGSGVTIQEVSSDDRIVRISYTMAVAPGTWEFVYADVPFIGITPVGARLNQAPETTMSVTDGIGHAIIRKRKVYTPRYAVRGARYQSAISLIDADDNTLLCSCYSGAKVHMDDIFTEAIVDNNYFTQKIILASRGELMGIGFHDSRAIAFKKTEFEYYDFTTKAQRILTGDCVSHRGIALTPEGYAIAGSRAITILRFDNGQDNRLNFDWLNLWDGTLKMTNGTSFITEEYRKNCVLWHSPFYNELMVHVQVNIEGVNIEGGGSRWECLRYSFTEHKWQGRRYFNLGNSGKIRYFANRNDKTLVIGTDGGIYKYPNPDGDHIYQDAVPKTDAVGSAMEAKIIQNLGSIHKISSEFGIWSVAHDTVADVISGDGLINVQIFPERSASAIGGTNKRPANQKAAPIGFGRYGKFRAARVLTEIPSVPSGNENTFGKFEISSLDVGVTIESRKGNA